TRQRRFPFDSSAGNAMQPRSSSTCLGLTAFASCGRQPVSQQNSMRSRNASPSLNWSRVVAVGVDPEAVLVLEDLEVALLDDVRGLRERLQAGVRAVLSLPFLRQQRVVSRMKR